MAAVASAVSAPAVVPPQEVLEAVVAFRFEAVALVAAAGAELFGSAVAAECAELVARRSDSVVLATVRAARRALALPVGPQARRATDSVTVNQLLDAWLQRAVLITANADGVSVPRNLADLLAPFHLSVHISSRATANEFGGLVARLERGFPSWQFPRTAAAIAAIGAADGPKGPAAHRSPRGPAWPSAVWTAMEATPPSSARARAERAAIALAVVVGGLPMTLARTVEVDHVTVMTDGTRGRLGVMLAVPPRPDGGRKVQRRRVTQDCARTAWTGGAGPLLQRHFVPWFRVARDASCTYLFPRFAADEEFDGTQPMAEAALRGALRRLLSAADVQWHDLRRGLEHAVDRVHELPGWDGGPVRADVKNALALRSNLSTKGSRDTYVHDAARDLFDATRRLHEVRREVVGGLVGDAAGGIAPNATDGRFSTACGKCGAHLSEDDPGALCDADAACEYTLCTSCFPHPHSVPLTCPAHTRGARARQRARG